MRREANQVADNLAHKALDGDFTCHAWSDFDSHAQYLLQSDAYGVSFFCGA